MRTGFSAFFSGCIPARSTRAPGSVWLYARKLWNATVVGSGWNRNSKKVPHSSSRCRNVSFFGVMKGKLIQILIVEDSPSDAFIVTEALKHSHEPTDVFAVHDGVEAMEFLRHQG